MRATCGVLKGAAAALVITLVAAACADASPATTAGGSTDAPTAPADSSGASSPGSASVSASASTSASASSTSPLAPASPAVTPTVGPAAPITQTTTTTAAAPAGVALPNPGLTPGQTFATATVSQVCTPGYAGSVRHVTLDQYRAVYGAYGIGYPEPSGTYELDHLIPLELGGDNADANLWPEPASPRPGFHEKDVLENTMHALVCSGRLDLREAQREIAANWYAAYRRYVGG